MHLEIVFMPRNFALIGLRMHFTETFTGYSQSYTNLAKESAPKR
jgi:hypothetical protein